MHYLVIGLGLTGLSLIDFLKRQGHEVSAWDGKAIPDGLTDIPTYLNTLPESAWDSIDALAMSPGVSPKTAIVQQAIQKNRPIQGDLSFFAEHNSKPIIAITGTNGKSTTTALIGEMAQAQGLTPAVIGNIGLPVLDALKTDYDVAVIECSSFQLAYAQGFHPTVGMILNITPDHLDWHRDFNDYQQAKHRIYNGATHTVCNRDDPTTHPQTGIDLGFHAEPSQDPLTQQFDFSRIRNQAKHYLANVLAALYAAKAMGWDLNKAFEAAVQFQGLPHRLSIIETDDGIMWLNDSKATNVSAAQVSIENTGPTISGKLIVIMGGRAKTDDFTGLIPGLKQFAKQLICLGEASECLYNTFATHLPCTQVKTFEDAVKTAKKVALPGDAVLLAPACTSWDMFKDYTQRGDTFVRLVKEHA